MGNRTTLNVLAVLFILAGALLTLENIGMFRGVSRLWPLLVLALGGGFLMLFFQRGREDVALLWIGTFLGLTSILFMYFSLTTWSRTARLWPAFLGVVGTSFLALSLHSARRIYKYLSVLFYTLFVAFTLVFSVWVKLWPVSLIIFGISLLSITAFDKRPSERDTP